MLVLRRRRENPAKLWGASAAYSPCPGFPRRPKRGRRNTTSFLPFGLLPRVGRTLPSGAMAPVYFFAFPSPSRGPFFAEDSGSRPRFCPPGLSGRCPPRRPTFFPRPRRARTCSPDL